MRRACSAALAGANTKHAPSTAQRLSPFEHARCALCQVALRVAAARASSAAIAARILALVWVILPPGQHERRALAARDGSLVLEPRVGPVLWHKRVHVILARLAAQLLAELRTRAACGWNPRSEGRSAGRARRGGGGAQWVARKERMGGGCTAGRMQGASAGGREAGGGGTGGCPRQITSRRAAKRGTHRLSRNNSKPLPKQS
eukprot:363769-Chlamydomonas_euryale.AAC.7